MGDIVTRLRDIASLRGNMSGSVIPIACTEAADEIERLKAEIKELQESNEYLRSRVPLFVREEDL